MYQTHNGFKMFVVDRKKFPNPWKAIFYDISFLKNNSLKSPIIWFGIIFFVLVIAFNTPDRVSKRIGLLIALIGIVMPYLGAWFRYYSELHIKDGRFSISTFGFTYCKGSLGDIIEIRRLTNWNGCLRVRTRGNSDISGFLIFSDDIPSVFQNVKIADGVYFNMGNDRKLSQN